MNPFEFLINAVKRRKSKISPLAVLHNTEVKDNVYIEEVSK